MSETNDCSECGFSDATVSLADVPAALRRFARRYRAPLTRFLPGEDGDALIRTRPPAGPITWSALEYAAHVRDVFAWYDEWVRRSLDHDGFVVEAPGPDEAAEAGRYNEADPAAVADDLAANADRLAATFESMPEEGWARAHVPRGNPRTAAFAARRAVHEGNHHLLDIGRVLRSVREGAG
ncbi:MAG TPA: DinB family protein [Acidimicrobiales bacterium]|nr:DinB family protein [Acidimicrobiales bacterium]